MYGKDYIRAKDKKRDSKYDAGKLLDEFNQDKDKVFDLIQTQKTTIHQTIDLFQEKIHTILVQWEEGFGLHMKELLDKNKGDPNINHSTRNFQSETFQGSQVLDTACRKIESTLKELSFQLELREMKQLSTVSLLVSNQESLEQEIQSLHEELVSLKHQHKMMADEFLTEMRSLFQQRQRNY